MRSKAFLNLNLRPTWLPVHPPKLTWLVTFWVEAGLLRTEMAVFSFKSGQYQTFHGLCLKFVLLDVIAEWTKCTSSALALYRAELTGQWHHKGQGMEVNSVIIVGMIH